MKALDMVTIGKAVKGIANILVGGTLISLSCDVIGDTIGQFVGKTASYDEAVKVIANDAKMLSEYKCEAASILKHDESKEYYKAVINVMKSDMLGSEKVKMINVLSQ